LVVFGSEDRDVVGIEAWEYKSQEPDNPWYPLPRDYGELDTGGKRQARLAALRRQDTPMRFVAAWDLFRRLYLVMADKTVSFYKRYAPSPPFHYEIIRDIGRYGRNVFGAPRGFGKSVVVGMEVPLFVSVTRQRFSTAVCLATDAMVEGRLEALQEQFEENSALIDDWGPMKATGRKRVWTKHRMALSNGSTVMGIGVMGRKRGARPDMFILDDPETDDNKVGEASVGIKREKFEQLLFSVVIPMLEKGSVMEWIGTIIDKQSFLHYALTSGDRRFEYWNKRNFMAGDPESDDPQRGRMLWPSKWDKETLRYRKAEIGNAAYYREYMGEVMDETDRPLRVVPALNHYGVEPDPVYLTEPLRSTAPVKWFAREYGASPALKAVSQEARDLFSKLFIMMTVDVCKNVSVHGDYHAVVVSGVDTDNCLWVLDVWVGRGTQTILLNMIFGMGIKWMPRIIGIESVGAQIAVVEAAKTMLIERGIEVGGTPPVPKPGSKVEVVWTPRVLGVDYTDSPNRAKKSARILTLEWRFARGKIKFPGTFLGDGSWRVLMGQIEDFTPGMELLTHDDALDTLAMTQYVAHGRGAEGPALPPVQSLARQIAGNNVIIVPGVSILSGTDACEWDMEVVKALADSAWRARTAQGPQMPPRPRYVTGREQAGGKARSMIDYLKSTVG
jgi:hypothetical protein